MFKRLLSTALVFGLASTAPPMALAQSLVEVQARVAPVNCAPRAAMVEQLETRYSETRNGAGLRSSTQVLELWASGESGTWTVLITRADGLSCIVASGTNWHNDAPSVAQMGVKS